MENLSNKNMKSGYPHAEPGWNNYNSQYLSWCLFYISDEWDQLLYPWNFSFCSIILARYREVCQTITCELYSYFCLLLSHIISAFEKHMKCLSCVPNIHIDCQKFRKFNKINQVCAVWEPTYLCVQQSSNILSWHRCPNILYFLELDLIY